MIQYGQANASTNEAARSFQQGGNWSELGVVKFNFYAARAEFIETGRADFVEEPEEG